jgi:hypothetical protein
MSIRSENHSEDPLRTILVISRHFAKMMQDASNLAAELGVDLDDLSSSNSGSDDDMDTMQDAGQKDIEREARKNELKRILREDAYQAAPHTYMHVRIALINLLREEAAVEELTEQREELASLLPLPSCSYFVPRPIQNDLISHKTIYFVVLTAEWRRWLSDEKMILFNDPASITTDSLQRIIDLFDKALNDFLSVEIWMDYLAFLQSLIFKELSSAANGADADQMDVDEVDSEESWSVIRDAASSLVSEQIIREKFESALRICAFHIRDSHLLWEAFRDFEYRAEKGKEDRLDALKDKIRKLYRRQLGSPSLSTFKNTYSLHLVPSTSFSFSTVVSDLTHVCVLGNRASGGI